MGSLQYDGVIVQFDDRLLAHLQIVIVQKLRHGESFVMSWKDSAEVGDGRSAIWMHPGQSLYFKFAGGRLSTINPQWLDSLSASANSSRGLVVITEQEASGKDAAVAEGQVVYRTGGPTYTKADPASPDPK